MYPNYNAIIEPICRKHIKGFTENKRINQSEKSRSSILSLQDAVSKMDSTLDQFDLTHHFAPNCYGREMRLPAGHVIVGKIHKHAHLNILQKGKVSVSTEEGVKELTAPCVFTSYAGTKRAVYILEDAIWITIHVTSKTDLEEIEDEVIAKNFEEIEDMSNKIEGISK